MPRVHESATLHIKLRGVNLTNVAKGWFATSSPAFRACAFSLGTSQLWQPIFTSGRIKDDLNPLWPSYEIKMEALCGCDTDRPIQFHLFDQDASGKDVGSMGAFETTISTLLRKKVEDINNVDVSKLYTLEEAGKPVGKIAVMDVWIDEPTTEEMPKTDVDNNAISSLASDSADSDSDDRRRDKGASTSKSTDDDYRRDKKDKGVFRSKSADEDDVDRRDKGDRGVPRSKSADNEYRQDKGRSRDKHSSSKGDDEKPRDKDSTANEKSKRRDEKASTKGSADTNSILHLKLEGVDMANVEGWFGCSGKIQNLLARLTIQSTCFLSTHTFCLS